MNNSGAYLIGTAFLFNAADAQRVGYCPFNPQENDLCLCVALAGNYFYDYICARRQESGAWLKVGKFGAYILSDPVEISERNFHLLCAGEPVELNVSRWVQPDPSEILLDDRCAAMTQATLEKLVHYDTPPTPNISTGKMWKSRRGHKWYFVWRDPFTHLVNDREVLVVS